MGTSLQKRECASCGQPFETQFCPNCGERRLTEKDYSAFSLVNDFVVDVFNIENKFWRTLKYFLIKPATYVDEYIKGARKKFISPIKLFLLANAWYFLFPAINTFKTTWTTQLGGLPYSSLTLDFLTKFQISTGLSASDFALLYNDATAVISKLFVIIQPLLFGLLTYLLYYRRKTEKPLIHHFNHSLVFYAFLLLIGVSIAPATYSLIGIVLESEAMRAFRTELNVTIFIFLILNIFGFFLYKKFFAEKWTKVVWKVLVLNLLFAPLLQIYRFILLWITLGWIWLTV
ncbi:MAG: DUF3667 domain-containing protein [bacterium]|nr:DUF3667 domain-containing protein [bacterium]